MGRFPGDLVCQRNCLLLVLVDLNIVGAFLSCTKRSVQVSAAAKNVKMASRALRTFMVSDPPWRAWPGRSNAEQGTFRRVISNSIP